MYKRQLQYVGNDQPSDTGGHGSAETGYGGDHSPQDRIKQEKTEEDTEKGTASAVPFLSGEIEPAQPENWQKEKILLEMTGQEIPYKIYEFYRNNPEETDREAYLYELYGDVKREAHTKDGILTAESGSSGFYILWSEGTSMKEAFWYWDEVSLEIGKRIEKGTYPVSYTHLEQVKLIPPVDLKPFVYVRISEHPDIPLEEAMPLNQAVELFGKLDRQAVEEKDMAGYYKTHFEICFLSEGEVMSYTGRQDFGDGEGNLLDHVKAFADYYLHTEEGQQLMKQTARTTEEWEHEQQQMRWVLEEMLPTLQYFCNLEKLETAVLEEQEIEKKVPLLTQGDASRKAYQEAMLAYIRESRIALNTGKELPCMPDIRDFATACPDKSYKEQVMEEIRQEAESYGMTVEAYAANGYEPPKRGGR